MQCEMSQRRGGARRERSLSLLPQAQPALISFPLFPLTTDVSVSAQMEPGRPVESNANPGLPAGNATTNPVSAEKLEPFDGVEKKAASGGHGLRRRLGRRSRSCLQSVKECYRRSIFKRIWNEVGIYGEWALTNL